MAAASQTIIIKTALSYQDVYEVQCTCVVLFYYHKTGPVARKCCSLMRWVSPQKRVVREETKLLSMMPLTGTNKANRTLLYSIQQEVSKQTVDFCDCRWKFCTIRTTHSSLCMFHILQSV